MFDLADHANRFNSGEIYSKSHLARWKLGGGQPAPSVRRAAAKRHAKMSGAMCVRLAHLADDSESDLGVGDRLGQDPSRAGAVLPVRLGEVADRKSVIVTGLP